MRATDVFESKYLKADDLQGKSAVRVTIAGVEMREIDGDKGKERRAVVTFTNAKKAFILNKTNWNILEEVCGSMDSDDWAGWTVTLYVTKVDYQGKRVPAIRISDQPGAATKPGGSMGSAFVTPEPEPEPVAITDSDIPF